MVILILIAFVVSFLLIDLLMNYLANKKTEEKNSVVMESKPFSVSSVSAPGGLFYDKSHTWVFMEKNGNLKIGLDEFLIKVTGPLTKVNMKKTGESIQKGTPALTIIQNGKKLSVNAPVSGKIVALNESIIDNIFSVNSSPYYNGWIYTIEPSNWASDNRFLLFAEKYKEWIKNEFTRLKDFLANKITSAQPQFASVVLQDGGELKENVLANLSPEVWEEFQCNFLNEKM